MRKLFLFFLVLVSLSGASHAVSVDLKPAEISEAGKISDLKPTFKGCVSRHEAGSQCEINFCGKNRAVLGSAAQNEEHCTDFYEPIACFCL